MMEREDIVAMGERTLEAIQASPPAVASRYLLRMTSGTSRTTPLLVATEYDKDTPNEFAQAATRLIGCSGSMNTRLSTVLFSAIGAQAAGAILPLDIEDFKGVLPQLLVDFAPDGFQGICSFVARAASQLPPQTHAGVRVLRLTGEPLSGEQESNFKKQFTNARHEQMYLAVELGRIGMRNCGHLPRNHFHPVSKVTIALEHEDDLGVGNILISKSFTAREPVVDYRIGDVGRMTGACPCGRAISFEVLGRNGMDYVKIAGALLRREALDQTLKKYSDFIADYRADASETDGKGLIVLRLLLGVPITEGLRQEVGHHVERNLFLTPSRTLADLITEGVFAPLVVEFTDTPFMSGHKDVKLRSSMS